MRARMIYPEFWDDAKMGRLSRDARLLYIATWGLCDDGGNFRCAPAYIRGQVFPYDDDVTIAHVDRWLAELIETGRLVPYFHQEERFANIPTFLRWQKIPRPSKWRHPEPDAQMSLGDEHSLSPHEHVSEGSALNLYKKQEVEVEVETETESGFADFWEKFPKDQHGKKCDKAKTQRAWIGLSRDERQAALVGVGHYRTACDAGRFAKAPLVWIHGKCWADWQEPPTLTSTTNGHHPTRSQNQINADIAARRMGLNPADSDPFGGAPDEPWSRRTM